MKIHHLLLILFLIFGTYVCLGQTPKLKPNETAEWLNDISTKQPIEKVYLQLNQPYYSVGDSIYFKAYVTLGDRHFLSKLSEVLHVDFISPENTLYKSLTLQLKDGLAIGDFSLEKSLEPGTYKIRAYTRWMLNNGQKNFLNIPIQILSDKKSVTLNSSHILLKPEFNFFPEGGTLTAGVESKVAFKAIDNNGNGINVTGSIIDNHDKSILTFNTTHLGMGSLQFKPDSGKTYRAKINFNDGTTEIVPFPRSNDTGLNLAAYNDSQNNLLLKVTSNTSFFKHNPNSNIFLILYTGGRAILIQGRLTAPVVTFEIHKNQYPSGIMQITLWTDSEPIAERLVFIKNTDFLNLAVVTDQLSYHEREKVKVNILSGDLKNSNVIANLSASVINVERFNLDQNSENNIYSHFLLNSEVKGFIEEPNYYFKANTQKTNDDLDILMLTQGFRRFDWKFISTGNIPAIKFNPERNLRISGIVKKNNGKPLINSEIILRDQASQGPEIKEITDSIGKFSFKNLVFTDTTIFKLRTKITSSRIIVFKETPPPLISPDTTIAVKNKFKSYELPNTEFNTGVQLKQVNIVGHKLKDSYRTLNLAGVGSADQILHSNSITGGGQVVSILNGRLHGVSFYDGVPYLTTDLATSALSALTPMTVIIDGIMIDPNMMRSKVFSINDLDWPSIETVEVLKSSNASIYGLSGGNGVLIFTTKTGSSNSIGETSDLNELTVALNGFYKARQFYTPKYDNSNVTSTVPDKRIAISWNPEIITDAQGKYQFEIFNSDIPGKYRILIEGIDNQGHIGRSETYYTVK